MKSFEFVYSFTEYVCKGLIHCGLVTPYGNIDLGQHKLR